MSQQQKPSPYSPAASINYGGSQSRVPASGWQYTGPPPTSPLPAKQPNQAPPGFGTTYNIVQLAGWARLGHPEYAGVYPLPTIPESVTGMAYPLSAQSAMKSGYVFTDFTEVTKSGITSLEYGFYTPAQMQEMANVPSAKGPSGIGALGKGILLSPDEARALGSGSAVKAFQVEVPKLTRQAEVAGVLGAAIIIPEIVPAITTTGILGGATASLGISEALNVATGKGILSPSVATESFAIGGLFSAGASGITGLVSSTAARATLIGGMGAGLGYVAGGPKGAIIGGSLAAGGYLIASGIQGVASEWLTGKAVEPGHVTGLGEKIVSTLTGVKPSLAGEVVDIPQTDLADVQTHQLSKLDVTGLGDLKEYASGFQSWSDPYTKVEVSGIKSVPTEYEGLQSWTNPYGKLSSEEAIYRHAFSPKEYLSAEDILAKQEYFENIKAKYSDVPSLNPEPSGVMKPTSIEEFDISVAPKTSGLLINKMPADTLASQWATEHLFNKMFGGVAYASVTEALAHQEPSKMPYTPEVASTEDLSSMAFTPFLISGPQVLVPKVKPSTETVMPYIPKVEPSFKEDQKTTPTVILNQLDLSKSLQSSRVDTSLIPDITELPDVTQTQKQGITQIQEQQQKQEQIQKLDIPAELRTTQTYDFTAHVDSGFDWRRTAKRKPIGLGKGFTSVFRGWPVRKPESFLNTNRGIKGMGRIEMTKPSTKRLKLQIGEERKSSKMYRGWGFPNIAKQETSHRRTLEKELRKRQGKRR
jgi:hypothetical protein